MSHSTKTIYCPKCNYTRKVYSNKPVNAVCFCGFACVAIQGDWLILREGKNINQMLITK